MRPSVCGLQAQVDICLAELLAVDIRYDTPAPAHCGWTATPARPTLTHDSPEDCRRNVPRIFIRNFRPQLYRDFCILCTISADRTL